MTKLSAKLRKERDIKRKSAYIYVCENPFIPGHLKIGKCKQHPRNRMRDLHTASVPGGYNLLWHTNTKKENVSKLETSLHHIFGDSEEGLCLNTGYRSEWYYVDPLIFEDKWDFVNCVKREVVRWEQFHRELKG